jgi:DNA-binding XRE family transcriptional regulator
MSVVAKLQVHVARSYAVTQCQRGSGGGELPVPPPLLLELPPAAGTEPLPELPPAPPVSALTPPCPALPGPDGAPPEPACSGGASEVPSPAAPVWDVCSPDPEAPAGSASPPLALHAPMPAAITTPDHHTRSGSRFLFIHVVLSSSPLDRNAALIRIFRTVYLSDPLRQRWTAVRPINPARLIQNVGARLGDLRIAAKLTQQEMADRLEVTLRYVQRVEAGEENLTLESLAQFANTLRVPLEQLFVAPEPRKRRPGRPSKPE